MKESVTGAYHRLNTEQVGRVMKTAELTAKVAASGPKTERFFEAMELASASAQRFQAMQAGWLSAWGDWLGYASTLEGADTVPKYMERVGNIGLRAQAQVAQQMNDTANLMENMSVNYAYWLAQQVEAPEED